MLAAGKIMLAAGKIMLAAAQSVVKSTMQTQMHHCRCLTLPMSTILAS